MSVSTITLQGLFWVIGYVNTVHTPAYKHQNSVYLESNTLIVWKQTEAWLELEFVP